jgi:phosphoenolpyruvate phosphomutase
MSNNPSPAKSLRTTIAGPRPLILGGAQDAISARLVEEAGFDAVWLSSFGVSVAAKALPDISLVTASEVIGIARSISAAVHIPIIADCESGYGDEHNFAHIAGEFERAGVAGVCVEDNEFPKRNSFYNLERHLVAPEEMTAKLASGLAARHSAEFLIIARTEALIAGMGTAEALRRAQMYEAAGADALVVQSRHWSDLQGFLREWRGTLPLVVIPTAFPEVSYSELADAGFRVIIFANQALRAAIYAMRETLSTIRRDLGVASVARRLSSLEEIERLVRLSDWISSAKACTQA